MKDKRGLVFDGAQLRMAMLRLVRDGVLARQKNEDGHYEYAQPKP